MLRQLHPAYREANIGPNPFGGLVKEIELTQGQAALVDEADYDWLAAFTWCALYDPTRGKFVAYRNAPRGTTPRGIYMHRLIMGAQEHELINHRDGNPLNNSRANLRLSSWSQSNAAGRRLSSNSSGFIGVTRHGKGWWARVRTVGKHVSCGVHWSAHEAARARDAKARELFGEFATLNFP